MEQIFSIINDNFEMAKEMERSAKDLAFLAQGVIAQTMYFKTKSFYTEAGQIRSDQKNIANDSLEI